MPRCAKMEYISMRMSTSYGYVDSFDLELDGFTKTEHQQICSAFHGYSRNLNGKDCFFHLESDDEYYEVPPPPGYTRILKFLFEHYGYVVQSSSVKEKGQQIKGSSEIKTHTFFLEKPTSTENY